MNKATKQHEVIYITSFLSKIEDDSDIMTYLALDEFADFLYPPLINPIDITDTEFIGLLVNFFNGINQNYNPEIHPKTTSYIVDFHEDLIPLIQGLVTKYNTVIRDPKKVEKMFAPVLKGLQNRFIDPQ